MALICDTGALYAAVDRSDADHGACARLLEETNERLVAPAPVLVELDWLIARRLQPAAFDAVLASVEEGSLLVEELTATDYRRIRELCLRYGDLSLGFVDAAVVAVAERLEEPKLATLDHRHFTVVRPAHVEAFTLLPR